MTRLNTGHGNIDAKGEGKVTTSDPTPDCSHAVPRAVLNVATGLLPSQRPPVSKYDTCCSTADRRRFVTHSNAAS